MKYPVPMPESFDSYYEYPLTSEERVTLGAQWLDKVVPGWERQIDISTLDIRDGHQCVCGQLFETGTANNGYANLLVQGLASNGLTDGVINWSVDHGFSYRQDTETWVALIKQRFDTGTLSDA